MSCERESEVLEAILAGRAPIACDCPSCRELVLVAGALRDAHTAALAEADVPPAATVWWRAQRRARQEALAAAARTITAVQTASLAAATTIALGLLGVTRQSWGTWLARLADGVYFGAFDVQMWSLALLIAAGTTLALAPLAVYLVVSKE